MILRLLLLLLLCVFAGNHFTFSAQKVEPVSAYQMKSIQGFTVLVHKTVLEHQKEAGEAFQELDKQLKEILRVVPDKPMAALRKIKIWLEWEKKKNGAAEYHPSIGWLKANGYNPEKAKCVELSNARNFVKWSRGEQPWMVLHELAHAYHHQVLGDRHKGIEAAYQQAVERKLYLSVPYIRGGKRKAYALNNSKEYYAELSEAYFGKNDFYPFTYIDLQKHDPVGFQVLEETWGKPNGK